MSNKDLISFTNLERILEEVLKQQRETTATLHYLKVAIEGHVSQAYVDEKLHSLSDQVGNQNAVLTKMRQDMVDVSNIANELPRLADAQAAGLTAIEQRVNMSMQQHLVDMKQRTLQLELELKGKATLSDARRLRSDMEDMARKEELTRLVEATNKLRDSLGNRMDDLTERIWGMRNESESNLTSSTGHLEAKLTGAQRTIEALETQQRGAASLLARLEKELLGKVTYPEVGNLKREIVSQMQDVHALLQEELSGDREAAGRLAHGLTALEKAVGDRASAKTVADLEARLDAQAAQLTAAHTALAVRATAEDLEAERAARQAALEELRAILEKKADSEVVTELNARAGTDTRRAGDEFRERSVALDRRLAQLERALDQARQDIGARAKATGLEELSFAQEATAGQVAELKVDLDSVLRNLEAWMFDEPLADDVQGRTGPGAGAGRGASVTVDALFPARSAGAGPPQRGAAPGSQGRARPAGRQLDPAPPDSRFAAPDSRRSSSSSLASGRRRSSAGAAVPSPRAQRVSAQAGDAGDAGTPPGPARSEVERRRRALDEKRKQIVADRLDAGDASHAQSAAGADHSEAQRPRSHGAPGTGGDWAGSKGGGTEQRVTLAGVVLPDI